MHLSYGKKPPNFCDLVDSWWVVRNEAVLCICKPLKQNGWSCEVPKQILTNEHLTGTRCGLYIRLKSHRESRVSGAFQFWLWSGDHCVPVWSLVSLDAASSGKYSAPVYYGYGLFIFLLFVLTTSCTFIKLTTTGFYTFYFFAIFFACILNFWLLRDMPLKQRGAFCLMCGHGKSWIYSPLAQHAPWSQPCSHGRRMI